MDETEASFKALDDAAVLDQLRGLADRAAGNIGVSELPVYAFGQRLLRQVFVNLLQNAVQACGEKGQIRIPVIVDRRH